MGHLIELCHTHIRNVLSEGDVAIDCTVGNGNDTVFLAKLVGENGKIFGFDIQKKAIDNTKKLLEEEAAISQVCLFHCSHANLLQYVDKNYYGKVQIAVFNLGYLPKGDKSLITSAISTLPAFDSALNILADGGYLVVVVYTGHKGGEEEWICIQEWFGSLDDKRYNLNFIVEPSLRREVPKLFFIRKMFSNV